MKRRIFVSLISLCAVTLPAMVEAGSLEQLLADKGVVTRGEAACAATGAAPKVYYKNGVKVEVPDAQAVFGLNAFIQTRYDFTDYGDAANTSSFRVNRARLVSSGSILNQEFEYYLQGEFAGHGASLKDAYLKWNVDKEFSVRAGQYKTPISRQFVNSDYAIQFADRSLASDYFDLDRNQGVEGTYAITPDLKLSAALFNGLSTGEGVNKEGLDTQHTGALFFRANLLGKMDAMKEGDVEHTELTAVNIGGAYAYSDYQITSGGLPALQHKGQALSLDANVKSQGMSVHTEFYWNNDDPDDAQSSSPIGGYIQAGYFLTPKHAEIAARYSIVSCDDGKAAGDCAGIDQMQEATAGLNYYFMGHSLKAQLNYVYRNTNPTGAGAGDTNDNRIVVQLSAYL